MCAQHQYDVWQFGYFCGLDFRGGGLPQTLTAPFYTDEGSTMWCNPQTGALMFSTDGKHVYRADGSVMPNGVGLRGGPSSSSSAIIIPFPTDDIASVSRFYVFCIGDQSWLDFVPRDSSLTMNIVDFSNELGGEVTELNTVIADGLAEKVVATQHCDGQSFWIVTHARSEPVFYAYNVTSTGIQPPVVSRVGRQLLPKAQNVLGGAYGQGLMAFSASGDRIAMAVPFSYSAEVFDFDISTGVVSNGVTVDSLSRTYGVCFSPSGRYVYTVEWVAGNAGGPPVRQFDVQSPGAATIVGRLADDQFDFHLGGIQLGPDGSVWLAESTGMAQIARPDVAGMQCDFRNNRIAFSSPSHVVIGLPNLVTSYFDKGKRSVCAPPIADIQSDSVICQFDCIVPANTTRNSPTSWTWEFEGGVPSAWNGDYPPSICYAIPGDYKIQLVAANAYGADTAVRLLRVASLPPISAGSDIILCDSASAILHATGASQYEWEYKQGIGNVRSPNPIVRVFESTEFIVHGTSEDGCVASDTVWVLAYPNGKPPVALYVTDVHGNAGDSPTVHVLKRNGLVTGSYDVVIHLPTTAFRDPVNVTNGSLVSISRNVAGTIDVRVRPHDINSDTVCSIVAQLLLFGGMQTIVAECILTDPCDTFVCDAGAVVSDACAKDLRLVTLQRSLLSIDAILSSENSIVISSPYPSTTLEIFAISGQLLESVTINDLPRERAVALKHPLTGVILVRLSAPGHSTASLFCQP